MSDPGNVFGLHASRYHWLLAGALLSLGLPALVIAGFGAASAASFALELVVNQRKAAGPWLPLFWVAGGLCAAAYQWFLVRCTVRSGAYARCRWGWWGRRCTWSQC